MAEYLTQYDDFILKPMLDVLKEGMLAVGGLADGIETYPLYEYLFQSIFLKMTGFQEQKLKLIHWTIATYDADFRWDYLQNHAKDFYSTYKEKNQVFNDLIKKINFENMVQSNWTNWIKELQNESKKGSENAEKDLKLIKSITRKKLDKFLSEEFKSFQADQFIYTFMLKRKKEECARKNKVIKNIRFSDIGYIIETKEGKDELLLYISDANIEVFEKRTMEEVFYKHFDLDYSKDKDRFKYEFYFTCKFKSNQNKPIESVENMFNNKQNIRDINQVKTEIKKYLDDYLFDFENRRISIDKEILNRLDKLKLKIYRDFIAQKIINHIKKKFFEELIHDCIYFNKYSNRIIDDILDHFFILDNGSKLFESTLQEYYELLYAHRNRCAHNTLSYQRNLPTLEKLADENYQFDNYYVRFLILILIDEIFILLFKEYRELMLNELP